jgi:putative intracellular protease/amidase
MPTMRHLVQLTVALDGTSGNELAATLGEVLKAAGVRLPDLGGGHGSGWRREPLDPPRATLHFTILADDEDELVSAVAAVEAGLVSAGVVLTERPMVASHEEKPPSDSPPDGLHWDDESRTLTIDSQARRSGDVEVELLTREEGVLLLIAVGVESPGGRREFAFPRVHRLSVRRA